MIYIQLLQNIGLLVSLTIFHGLIIRRFKSKKILFQIISGFLFGLVALIGMKTPVNYIPGVIFDGRSIVLSIAGFFGGPITACIAALMAGIYRWNMGGDGALMGVCVVTESAIIGTILYYLRKRNPNVVHPFSIFLFGLIVHVIMVGLMTLLPGGLTLKVFQDIGIPTLLVYPPATFLLCYLFLEIESRVKSEIALKKSEERYQLAMDATQDGLWDWDLSTGGSHFNSRYYTMLGYEPGEFPSTSEDWAILIHPDDKDMTIRVNNDCIENRISHFKIEYRIKAKSGEWKWILGRGKAVSRDKNGRALRLIGTHTDISERRFSEAALRESEEKYRLLIENSHDIIYTLTSEGKFLFVSPAWSTLLGHPVHQIVGQQFQAFVHPDDLPVCMDFLNTVIKSGQNQEGVEYRVQHINGDWYWHTSSAVPLLDKVGKVTGFVGIARDITEQKKAEEALKESEEKYRVLFENAGEAVFIVQDNLIVYANPVTSELSGIPIENLLGCNLFDFSDPKDVQKDMEYQKLLVNGEVTRVNRELRYKRFDGTLRWMHLNSVLIKWEGHTATLNFGNDITEQKYIEEALKKSEEQYRYLIQNMRDIIWQTDSNLTFTFINNYVERVTGYTPDELIGKPLFKLLSEKSVEYVIERSRILREKLLKGESVGHSTFEVEMVSKSGERKWIEISSNPVFDDQNNLIEFYGVSRDVTDKKIAEEALMVKSIELERYFTSALDLLCIADTDGHFRKLNPEWESALGYKLEELIGSRFLDYVHPEDLQETLNAISILSSNKAILNFTNRYKHKNGTYRWMEWRSYPESGLIYAVARDITDRKSAEEDRIEMERRMLHVQKLESLGVLAGGMAHDFNNILMAVLGHAELALMDLPAMSPARESLIEIEKASKRAADLSRQMLAYSGRGKFVIEQIKLGDVISEMVHLLKASITKKAILNLNLEHELPAIEGDATQIRQILMNLITNASDAIGDRSGVISISTGAKECDREYLANTFLDERLAEGLYVYIEVSDTGIGMTKETMARIFEPFYTTKFTGRGLGMAAVLGIVRGHKGAIIIYSEIGKGSTFRILFPAVEISSEIIIDNIEFKSPSKKTSGFVLLVDDEETIRDVGKRMLEHLGYEVITAIDGIDGCKQFEENHEKIQLVLLDLTMPRRDGEETYRELRRINPKVRVILTSGFTEQEITARFAGKGLAGFIQKPFSVNDLTVKILEVIEENEEIN